MTAVDMHLQIEDIILDLPVRNKLQLFEKIGQHMQCLHALPADEVAASLLRRENIASTALGDGVLIPHTGIRGLSQVHALYIRSFCVTDFETLDGIAITDVFVLLLPAPVEEEHLGILAEVVAMFADPAFRLVLHSCANPPEVKEVFDRWSLGALLLR